jgi:high-affinity nickel-transport protein
LVNGRLLLRAVHETFFWLYTFGLRYAVDADHIATTDNVTRKLMETGKLP